MQPPPRTGEPVEKASRTRALALAARKVLRAFFGSAPWPGAGKPGRLAAALLALGALVVVAATLGPASSGTLTPRRFDGIGNSADDFGAYATGAAILARGEAPRLYDTDLQTRVQRELLAQVGAPLEVPNTYVNPPLMAALFLPFLWLGLPGGAIAWRLATLGMALWAVLAVARKDATGRVAWQRGAALTLCCVPFVQAWQLGSMVGLQLMAFGGWLAWSRGGRPFLAGLMLSLLLLKPQYLPFPLLYLLWKGQWRQLLGCAAGLVAQGLATLALIPLVGGAPDPGPLLTFATLDATESRVWVETVTNHISLRARLRDALPGLPPTVELALLAAATAVFSAGVLWRVGRKWRADQHDFWWEALAVASATGLTAFHNHVSGLVFLLPPAAALLAPWHRAGEEPSSRRARSILAVLLAVPTLGILAVAAWFPLYIASAWMLAVGSLVLGLRELHGREPPRAAGT